MRKKLTAAIAFLALLVLAAPALAAGGASNGPDDDLGGGLNKLLVGTLITAITAIGARVWGWLGHRKATAKLVRYAESHGLIQDAAQQAIDYAAELAHKAIKSGMKYGGDLKESAAVERGLELLDGIGFLAEDREKAAAELRKVILARLGAMRAPDGGKLIATRLRSSP